MNCEAPTLIQRVIEGQVTNNLGYKEKRGKEIWPTLTSKGNRDFLSLQTRLALLDADAWRNDVTQVTIALLGSEQESLFAKKIFQRFLLREAQNFARFRRNHDELTAVRTLNPKIEFNSSKQVFKAMAEMKKDPICTLTT